MLPAAQLIFIQRSKIMYKVLKSFCCLLLFSILNLCGVSAVDYSSFNNHEPFNCSKCGKKVEGYLKFLGNVRASNEYVDKAMKLFDLNSLDVYTAFVRLDDKKVLMCVDCGREDMHKQIELSVKEFCPKFNFQSPCREDVENLIRNKQFIQEIPIEYICSGVFEDKECVCKLCNKGLGGIGPAIFEEGNYASCVNCRNVFHGECVYNWVSEKNEICPVCKGGSGLIWYNAFTITEKRLYSFVTWVNDSRPSSFQSRLEFFKNANKDDFAENRKFKEEFQKCKTLDEVLDLLFPGVKQLHL
jgi:hypothetical protein